MASARRTDPFVAEFSAALDTLADRAGRLRPAALQQVAYLAWLRRAWLGVLPAPAGSDLTARWDWAASHGCPLLDPALDRGLVEEPCAVAQAMPAPPEMEPGELYLRLQDLRVVRRARRLQVVSERGRRRRSGTFFTPPWMAERLAQLAIEPLVLPAAEAGLRSLAVLDPACGDGRLLVACLRQILGRLAVPADRRAAVGRQLIAGCLYGVDRDPLAVALARTALWTEVDPELGPLPELAQRLQPGDALSGPLRGARRYGAALRWERAFPERLGPGGGGFSVVVANPPFEVLTGFSSRRGLESYVGHIRTCGYELALGGNLNTYRLFLERALRLLSDGGRLAFVLPVGFLSDRSAAPLRAALLRPGWLEHVEVYAESSRVFAEAGQAVVLLSAAKRQGGGSLRMVDGGNGRVHVVGRSQIEALDPEAWPLPLAAGEDLALAARLRARNPACLGDRAEGRVGEVDQTHYRSCLRSQPDRALLVRGAHLAAFRVDLSVERAHERWLDEAAFEQQRGGGNWRQDVGSPRIAQTGIVNMEAARRLVAAEVPPGVYLGNSINYWVPSAGLPLSAAQGRGYLLGLLNSAPLEWRFRLTSSNHNINLYELRSLPLPELSIGYPAERLDGFLARSMEQLLAADVSPLGRVRQVTAGWGAPARDDRAVALLLASVARRLEAVPPSGACSALEHVLDHLVNWHLGLDEPDLERMLGLLPARRWSEKERT